MTAPGSRSLLSRYQIAAAPFWTGLGRGADAAGAAGAAKDVWNYYKAISDARDQIDGQFKNIPGNEEPASVNGDNDGLNPKDLAAAVGRLGYEGHYRNKESAVRDAKNIARLASGGNVDYQTLLDHFIELKKLGVGGGVDDVKAALIGVGHPERYVQTVRGMVELLKQSTLGSDRNAVSDLYVALSADLLKSTPPGAKVDDVEEQQTPAVDLIRQADDRIRKGGEDGYSLTKEIYGRAFGGDPHRAEYRRSLGVFGIGKDGKTNIENVVRVVEEVTEGAGEPYRDYVGGRVLGVSDRDYGRLSKVIHEDDGQWRHAVKDVVSWQKWMRTEGFARYYADLADRYDAYQSSEVTVSPGAGRNVDAPHTEGSGREASPTRKSVQKQDARRQSAPRCADFGATALGPDLESAAGVASHCASKEGGRSKSCSGRVDQMKEGGRQNLHVTIQLLGQDGKVMPTVTKKIEVNRSPGAGTSGGRRSV